MFPAIILLSRHRLWLLALQKAAYTHAYMVFTLRGSHNCEHIFSR